MTTRYCSTHGWEFDGCPDWLPADIERLKGLIAAALACHIRGKDRSSVTHGFEHCAECGKQWDIEADRCTSPTVQALLGS